MALSVVYALDTGHVVGALALTGGTAPVDPAALVGRALPVRVSLGAHGTATLPLDARNLAVAAVDDEPGVLAEPLAYGVDRGSDGKPKPTLLHLPSWTSGGLVLAKDVLKVTVPHAPTSTVKVVALISGAQDTHVLAGEIPAQQTELKLSVDLAAAASYGVLVLVAGWAGLLERKDVP
ncbi:hypothetical protein ABZ915_02515 [Streptomyces sp. NPDC046915]|uniref:hypothetical protein n=1 Tax=Streptomyces sp. NPDC046915 TaxID=3155257 RepID=UPI0033FA9CC9